MIDVNTQLQALFNGHGIATMPLDQKFLLVSKQLALVESRVNQQEFPNGVSSRLDVSLTIKDQVIIECFGDVGDTAETAIDNNLQNFARNSLHIIIGALQNVQEDDQFDVEQWNVNEHTWRVYCGNYGLKSIGNKPIHIPAELFTRIEGIIHNLPLSKEYHWFRFFFSCNNSKISAAEFLYDNEVFEEATQELINLDWQLTPEFYSVRLFLVLRRQD
ncbi:MAG: DUF6348 family protein [Bacteroidota bacterium]|nr:DUF6348 family protein [Bacteroidota bacterium]